MLINRSLYRVVLRRYAANMADDIPPDPASRRGRGRPRVDQRGVVISTWVPERVHDVLIKVAECRGESVSAVVSRLLIVRLQR